MSQNPIRHRLTCFHIRIPIDASPETVTGMFVSLGFWICLLIAIGMFALVSLSPKLIDHANLDSQWLLNQHKLVRIEKQNEQLQRVVDAIRQDKEFAAEMVRVEFDAVRPDEEIIPVDSSLCLTPAELSIESETDPSIQQWYLPWIEPCATNNALRFRMLFCSALLVVVSFTWLQPLSHRPKVKAEITRPNLIQMIKDRYTRPA